MTRGAVGFSEPGFTTVEMVSDVELPFARKAVTVKVYRVPLVSPVKLQLSGAEGLATRSTVQVVPPGCIVTT